MSKTNLTKKERARLKALQSQPAPVEKGLTFWQAIKWLFSVIWWRIKPSEYMGKSVNYMGKYRSIVGETSTHFFLADFPKIAFPKAGNKYKIK